MKNLLTSAGDMGSSPGPGRSHIPWSNYAHVPQLLSLFSRGHKPQLLSPGATTTEACTPRAHGLQQREVTTMRSPGTKTKSSPRSLQLEKAHAQQQRPNTAKKKIIIIKKIKNKTNYISKPSDAGEEILRGKEIALNAYIGKIKAET